MYHLSLGLFGGARALSQQHARARAPRTCLMRARTHARSYPARVGPDAQSAHIAQSPLLASSGQTPNPQDPEKKTQDPPGSPKIRPRLHQASPRFLEDPPKTFQDPQDPAKPFPRSPRHHPKRPIITSRSLVFSHNSPASFPPTIYQESFRARRYRGASSMELSFDDPRLAQFVAAATASTSQSFRTFNRPLA